MHEDNIFKLLSLSLIWAGISCIMFGLEKMNGSGYVPPGTPAGWVMGMVWIGIGEVIGMCWSIYMCSSLIAQKCAGKPRWTKQRMLTAPIALVLGIIVAILGTYLTWRHPYKFGPCGCSEIEWGPQCRPCRCGDHGICDSGVYGSGRCSCDLGWAGDLCDQCDERRKPEGRCDVCKTGFDGEKCEFCARGYAGEDCDICAVGWQPWYNSSALFPKTIAADDGRHLCDECRANHWGYNCLPCPYGKDVPHVTMSRNFAIVNGTRAADSDGRVGVIVAMQLKDAITDRWSSSYQYDLTDPQILEHVQIKLDYDYEETVSPWWYLKDIQGIQCNNRGTCEDDDAHQARFPDWQQTCTADVIKECTVDSDCTVSENCKGTCLGVDLPVSPLWFTKYNGALCSSDDECFDPDIFIDDGIPYTGGRCVSRFCCDQTRHGDGECDCTSGKHYFGPKDDDMARQLYELSPACDFCPGYDWINEEPKSVCSGGRGTCSTSRDRNGQYLQMRCTCGETVWADPETGIVDIDRIVVWKGDLCQCGDWDEDNICDTCASGYWGEECKPCPGGAGANQCSGHGTCNSGVEGDGTCTCDVDRDSSWALGPYVERFPGDCNDCKNAGGNSDTCNECAPNFFGDKCLRCPDTDLIQASEIQDIFQPFGSFLLGPAQSSKEPQPVCIEGTDMCTLACGGGGWCDWGRRGTGTCLCWSNFRTQPTTWNPLDNVCIGNDQEKEQCPAFGYCSNGDSSRATNDLCGRESFVGTNKDMATEDPAWTPYADWSETSGGQTRSGVYDDECRLQNKGICYKWNKMDWTASNSLITCVRDE